VPTKRMGKKHGKQTVKASRWFRRCCLRAIQESLRPSAKRLTHFTRSHTSVLTLSLPVIGLMICGVLIVSISSFTSKKRC